MAVVSFNNVCGTFLILALIFIIIAAGKPHLQDKNRTCIPAEEEPKLNWIDGSCYPLVNFTRPFCQNFGITLPNYVYQTPDRQNNRNNEANKDYDTVVKLRKTKLINLYIIADNNTLEKCLRAVAIGYCHLNFASCDRTSSVFKEQKICYESCIELTSMCGEMWEKLEEYYAIFHPNRKFVNCKLQPSRNAGDSPECWYFNEDTNSTDTSSVPDWATNANCLYLNGNSYHGNISVTASSIPCQSWTEQCPHRHTMNKTYPELNNAKNYCRNPKNSGKRPWCFTTDRNKRWEYCDIPKCIPVDGSYGNWSLSTCNVTCGSGFGTWTRKCDNPEPKNGGRNCSHLGESVAYRPCSAKPCPVNGGYSNWTLTIPCNVSCGNGVEIWRRFCNSPQPKYGGYNCSNLGNFTEFRNCSRTPCPPIDDGVHWRTSPCSVTCGQGVQKRTRVCANPPGKYNGNCSKQGPTHQVLICKMKPCLAVHVGHLDSEKIGITVVAVVFVIILTLVILTIFILRRRRKKASRNYAHLESLPQSSLGPQELEGNNTSEELPSSALLTGASSIDYKNQANKGDPASDLSVKFDLPAQDDAAENRRSQIVC